MKFCVTSFFSQQLKPSRTLTVWSWRGRWRRGVGQRAAPEKLTWRTFTDSTGIHILFWFFFSEEVLSVIVLMKKSVCVLWSEELTSYQRELEVLSQQFSLKCLENGHLVQALDAERKALCQCQQENQDLRTRNQVRAPIHTLIRLLHVRMGRGILTTVFSDSSRSWAVTSRQRSPDFVPWRNRTPCSSIRGWMCTKWRWVSSSFAPVQTWKHRKETVQMKMRGSCYLTRTFHPF